MALYSTEYSAEYSTEYSAEYSAEYSDEETAYIPTFLSKFLFLLKNHISVDLLLLPNLWVKLLIGSLNLL